MKANTNVVLSPFSLSMAMGMLQQGTLGQTEKDIGSTLFNGLSKENVAKKFKQLKQVSLNKKNPPSKNSLLNTISEKTVYVLFSYGIWMEFRFFELFEGLSLWIIWKMKFLFYF